jgi:hypothetical protein
MLTMSRLQELKISWGERLTKGIIITESIKCKD